MKRTFDVIRSVFSSTAVTPVVIGFFLLLYIGIAFVTDETLIFLIDLTRKNLILALILALIPLNCLARVVSETARFLARRRMMGGKKSVAPAGLFDESVVLSGTPRLDVIRRRLAADGYRTELSEDSLAVWRGFSCFPARLVFLLALFSLFSGILLSVTTRVSSRNAIIEGEPLPPDAGSGRVARILFQDYPGLLMNRTLAIDVVQEGTGAVRRFGLYPPALSHGSFVYPRYLGVAPLIRFSAPDLSREFASHVILMIYPPGKEDSADIPGTGYRIVFSLAAPEQDKDPYMTGQIVLQFKILKEKEPVLSGIVPVGGEFSRDGYLLSFPEFRRVVASDMVKDSGVIFIWSAFSLFALSLLLWVPVRIFAPRREMVFLIGDSTVQCHSRAEGGAVRHSALFHEALDSLYAGGGAGRLDYDE